MSLFYICDYVCEYVHCIYYVTALLSDAEKSQYTDAKMNTEGTVEYISVQDTSQL